MYIFQIKEQHKKTLIELEAFFGYSMLPSSANQQFCKPFLDWIHPQLDWRQKVLEIVKFLFALELSIWEMAKT
jgi:hypothetical protein